MAHTVRVEARTDDKDWPDALAILRERLPSGVDVGQAAGRRPSAHRIEMDVEART